WSASMILDHTEILDIRKICYLRLESLTSGRVHRWFSVKRQHALMTIADSLYYTKFKLYCKPGMEGGRNCYADEHYMPTLFNMMDPNGIANWSVTHVDWSEGKWHPKAYRAQDVTYGLLKNITSIDMSHHVTSDSKVSVSVSLSVCLFVCVCVSLSQCFAFTFT
uniref:Uncharacterized protein n=1 Tax=Aegilops tauschii subsp. strangulata TaxID=200361 RepID=A0A453CT43_AEGTS